MSVVSALARMAELQAAFAPPAPAAVAPTAAPAQGQPATSFASALGAAMGPTAAPTAGAPVSLQAAPGTYPHLTGDLDAHPELLARLERLAAARGESFTVNSGLRTHAEQTQLWQGRANNPFPVARPGSSLHESGRAADVSVNGRPIQEAIPAAELVAAGLRPLAGDAVHVELAA